MRMLHCQKYLVLWALVLTTNSAFALSLATPKNAYYSQAFYSDVSSGLKDEELVRELQKESSRNQNVLGYDRARVVLLGDMYLEKDDSGQYFIKDVYCLKDYRGGGIGPRKIPDNTMLNTEHTWPQSRFTNKYPKDMQKSDLHHLFPSDTKMNSTRGNFKFADIEGQTQDVKCDESRFGRIQGAWRFEPPQVHKGNVARALFYFSVRYAINIDADEEVFLRRWHQEDPVDDAEILHHEQIFKAQGNRNPFIDHPELVQEIENF